MEENFNNLINEMKNQKLTDSEKSAIWFRVETFMQNNPMGSFGNSKIKTPYFSRHHFFTAGKVLVTSFLLMAIGFGGLSYSSASALPGETLYTLKINVKEKIEEKLVFSSAKKIDLRKKRIETRFTEVENLIKKNKVTKENREIVEKNIKAETAKIEEDLAEIKTENPEMAVQAQEEIVQSIKEHQEKISLLVREKTESEIQNQENNKTEIENKEKLNTETTEATPEDSKKENIETKDQLELSTQTQAIQAVIQTENSTESVPVVATEIPKTETTQENQAQAQIQPESKIMNAVISKTQATQEEEKLLVNSLEILTVLGNSNKTISPNNVNSNGAN
jgi:hypothetical protein